MSVQLNALVWAKGGTLWQSYTYIFKENGRTFTTNTIKIDATMDVIQPRTV